MNNRLLKKVIDYCDIDSLYYQLKLVDKRCKKICENYMKPKSLDWILLNMNNVDTIKQCVPNNHFYKLFQKTYKQNQSFKYIKSFLFLQPFFENSATVDFFSYLAAILDDEERMNKWQSLRDHYSYSFFGRPKRTKCYYTPLFNESQFWFDVLLIMIQYKRFPANILINDKRDTFTFHQWNQFYRRCHKYGRFDLISLIPTFDKPFLIDYRHTFLYCINDDVAQKLLPLVPTFETPLSINIFVRAKNGRLFSVLSKILDNLEMKVTVYVGFDFEETSWALANKHSPKILIPIVKNVWNFQSIYESEIMFDHWYQNKTKNYWPSLPSYPTSQHWIHLMFWNSHQKVIEYFDEIDTCDFFRVAVRSLDALKKYSRKTDSVDFFIEPLSPSVYKWLIDFDKVYQSATLELIFHNDVLYKKFDDFANDFYDCRRQKTHIFANFIHYYTLNKNEKIVIYSSLLTESKPNIYLRQVDYDKVKEWAIVNQCNKVLKLFNNFNYCE